MSVVNTAHTRDIALERQPAVAAAPQVPLWQRPRFYQYGFLVVLIAVWEMFGPLINPILFSYPSKIALAAFHLTFVTGELPYYAAQSLQVLVYGLAFGVIVGSAGSAGKTPST